ncbi:hypothetical protein YYC_01993 [Plasmodium yoelii 17X]|uniref:3'-5' exonuclease domain-containing protein n=1 Tax=Plasmodium yoelii 17X TaxID=1323249 RepID=V7PN69_PLAYE|nr:hypothetical protein YYC_01993 [Plasmodium yoelii 17X]
MPKFVSLFNYRHYLQINGQKYNTLSVVFLDKLSGSIQKENKFREGSIKCYFDMTRNCKYLKKDDYINLFKLKRHCYYSTDNKVYVKGNVSEIISSLCKNKDIEGIAANIIFYIIKLMEIKNIRTTNEYKENIKEIFINLVKTYHKICKCNNGNIEYIFSIFNQDVIKSVSPNLKNTKKKTIQELVLNSLSFFFKNNEIYKNNLDINLICDIVSHTDFLIILNNINYEKEQIEKNLNVKSVDYLVGKYLSNKIYITTSIEFISIFLSSMDNPSIYSPLKENSSFNCVDILNHILKNESKNSLFLFFDTLEHSHLKLEAFRYLLSVDQHTGLFSNYWGYLTMKEYLLSNVSTNLDEINKIESSNQWLIKKSDIKNSLNNDIFHKYNEESSSNISNDHYTLPDEIKNICFIKNMIEFEKMTIEIQEYQTNHWINNIYMDDDIYNIDYNNNLTEIENINRNLRMKKKKFYVGIDVEWNRKQKASVISFSTCKKVYVVDLFNIDYNYKLLVYKFLKWILENPFIYKLFFNFLCDIYIMSMYFKNISNLNTFINVIDLKKPLSVEKCNNGDIYNCNNIINAELMNRNILENNDTELFKKLTNSSTYNFKKEIENKFNGPENIITALPKKINKHYFKSLNDLCFQFLRKKLSKKLQLSNWNKRPLSKEQIEYAGLDAYVLIPIEEKLIDEKYISSCDTNSHILVDSFIQKYNSKNCSWDW